MQLGIVVVYLVREADGGLLNLHLRQIEKHTQVPYRIYGTANRLLPAFRQRLEQHPQVRLCECPTTDLRGSAEHAYYLEHLTRWAVEDGMSHIVTLHVDSFPMRTGWAEELAAKLSESCVFATFERINTACLLFRRDFYLKSRPTFHLSEKERAGAGYRRYFEEYAPVPHSGIGYGFRAYTEGLSWYYLRESPTMCEYGKVYDDMIFHLRGAVKVGEKPPLGRSVFARRRYIRFLQKLSFFIPKDTKRWFRTRFSVLTERVVDRPTRVYEKERFELTRKALLEDPETFLKRVQTGQKA
jgi:hypothetical protein